MLGEEIIKAGINSDLVTCMQDYFEMSESEFYAKYTSLKDKSWSKLFYVLKNLKEGKIDSEDVINKMDLPIGVKIILKNFVKNQNNLPKNLDLNTLDVEKTVKNEVKEEESRQQLI